MSILPKDEAFDRLREGAGSFPGAWLFAGGGVISGNPSEAGGTAAWVILECAGDGVIEKRGACLIEPENGPVSNNYTEMEAVLLGMVYVVRNPRAYIVSDSLVTLRRLFEAVPWSSTTDAAATEAQRRRLSNWVNAGYITADTRGILLAGHPSPADLESGIGKHGYPVRELNVWCDKACTSIARLVARVAQERGVDRREATRLLVRGRSVTVS